MARSSVRLIVSVAIFLLPVACVFVALFCGRYTLTLPEVCQSLVSWLPGYGAGVSSESATLVLQVRLPRALAAVAVGAALGASGAAFQGVFRNPLVNPGLLGVSNGAGFGAALAIVLFGGGMAVYPSAFLFGIVAVGASYWIARVYKSTPTIMLILGGTIVSSVFSALVSLMKYVADAETQLPSIVYWLMGSLSSVGWESFWSVAVMALGCLVLVTCAWRVDVLSMGDKEARSLGLEVNRDKGIVIAEIVSCDDHPNADRLHVCRIDDGGVVGNQHFFVTNDRANGGARWQVNLADTAANHLARLRVAVGNRLNGFGRTPTQ